MFSHLVPLARGFLRQTSTCLLLFWPIEPVLRQRNRDVCLWPDIFVERSHLGYMPLGEARYMSIGLDNSLGKTSE